MARLPRLEWPGQLHYLVLRGRGAPGGPRVFTDAVDRQAFVAALREAAAAEAVRVHGYALLHDEAQLLVTPTEGGALGRLVQAVGRRYVSAYNRRHCHRGSLWAGRYHAAAVEAGDAGLAALRLVDGASAEPDATSAGARTGAPRETWLVDPPEFWALGNTPFEREAVYRSLLAQGLAPAQAESLRRAAMGGWAWGSAAFLTAAERATARPAAPRARGRPRKLP